jgi:hypothetical protein
LFSKQNRFKHFSVFQIFQIEATDFDLLSSSHLNDPRLLSAFKIIVFCWKLKDSLLICDKCCREIPINIHHLILDPILSHRSWCPVLKSNQWKNRIEQIENILYKKSRKDIQTNKTEHILSDIISTQNLFHELISSKEYYRSSVQSTFVDNTSTSDIDNKSMST